MAGPTTALSPEWDRWFDETFTDLISNNEDLTRAEFDALVSASWPAPAPPASSDAARDSLGDSTAGGREPPPESP
ncbi:MAG: hypothetical protein QOE61_1427 [Micromonosporaceae bacterium]|nr:hypothetical protein [Micromonosporaceae bacterium]